MIQAYYVVAEIILLEKCYMKEYFEIMCNFFS